MRYPFSRVPRPSWVGHAQVDGCREEVTHDEATIPSGMHCTSFASQVVAECVVGLDFYSKSKMVSTRVTARPRCRLLCYYAKAHTDERVAGLISTTLSGIRGLGRRTRGPPPQQLFLAMFHASGVCLRTLRRRMRRVSPRCATSNPSHSFTAKVPN